MEIIGFVALLLLASAFCFRELSNLVKQLKSSKPQGLLGPGKILEFNVSVSSKSKKSEVCDPNTNSKKDSLD